MNKKNIYTVGYTLFRKDSAIDIEHLFNTLKKYGVNYLVDIRSTPFSKQYPECNADNLKFSGKKYGIPYMHMEEFGAKANSEQEVYSKASEIFLEEGVFPIAKSNRPEKTELQLDDEIVDFRKFRNDSYFLSGLNRIEVAYDKNFTLCFMCSEKKPIDCHRYFLVGKSLQHRFGEWLEIRHIMENSDGSIDYISNKDLDVQLKEFVCLKMRPPILPPIFKDEILNKYHGTTTQEKLDDFCDRYWNLIHGWKKINNNNEHYD